jgi:flagellar hook-length control protein FliK
MNPPHLGPVEVSLNLSDDAASIAFASPHAAVRDAIEASLGDLRQSLSDRGLQLGQALVSADSGQAREQFQQEQARAAAGRGGHGGRSGPGEPLPVEAARARVVSRGLVDLFA